MELGEQTVEKEIYQDYETLKKMAREEVFKEIMDFFGLTIKDLPAFPPKDADMIKLALVIGKAKILEALTPPLI